jgi:hypothetical protein
MVAIIAGVFALAHLCAAACHFGSKRSRHDKHSITSADVVG